MKTISFGRPMIHDEERQAVLRVLEGTTLTHGPVVREFETRFAAFTGAQHAVATSSCTAAMHLAYLHIGLQPGDEVIMPAQSHVATAHAVELCGANCRFVDSEPETGNLNLGHVESLISPRTRAIAVMHYLGMPVDMEAVVDIARRRDLFVVEDCALALGTTYRGVHSGLWGDVGCFSFYPVKHITTAEGGMIITRNADRAADLASRRAFGIDRHVVDHRAAGAGYDVLHLGSNYRLNEISAALGVQQIQRLPAMLEQRRRNEQQLREGLSGREELRLLQSSHGYFCSSAYCLVAVLQPPFAQHRHRLIQELARRGIQTSIYYPHPIPHLQYYRNKYPCSPDSFPVAAALSARGVALPVGPHLGSDDIAYVLDGLRQTLAEVARS